MRRLTLAAAALIVLLSPVFADDGCDKFAWPLARERTLFAAADKASVNAGAVVAAIPKSAFVVNLLPGAQAVFAMPPERQPQSERWFGGVIRLPALDRPGIYQVTLSEEAWIDIVQDDRYARSVGMHRARRLPGLAQERAA